MRAAAEERAEERSGRARLLVLGSALLALHGAPLHAQAPWRISASLSEHLTWTNNVDLQPSATRQSDFIFTLTPGLRIAYEGERAQLSGSIAAPILLYARTGEDNNRVVPQVNLRGQVEVVKDWFFVEASADVQETFYNPFGPQPPGLENVSNNRYTQSTFRVAPYIQGFIGSNIRYVLRDENIWANLNDSPINADAQYTNALTGSIDRIPTPFGWGADISRTEFKFSNQQQTQLMELARLRGVYRPSSVWELFVSGGYERNEFPLSQYDGPIYGLGFRWRPTERTRLDAGWEERFFGGSYYLLFDHRTPRTAWNVTASRNVSTFPQQAANLPAGTFLPFILNQILLPRIPNPADRAQFIVDFMRDRGLPLVLGEPLALYTQQVELVEQVSASFAILGVRNSVVFSAYTAKTEPISASGDVLPPVATTQNNNTQFGGGATWSYTITSNALLSFSGNASRTDANPPFTGRTDQWSLRLMVTRPLSPRTNTVAGARYQNYKSDFQNSYNETAVFVGASHTFD